MTRLKVSVNIPVRNGENTLTECLNSFLNQTYKNYEVVIADNSSTDNTKKIIKHFQNKSKKFKYVYEKQVSEGAARNAALMASRGNIICTTDADCIVPINWIEKLINPIVTEKEDAVVGFQKPCSNNYWSIKRQKFDINYNKKVVVGKYINHLDTKNFAIKKSVLKKHKFNNGFPCMADFELYLRLSSSHIKLRYLPNLLVKHKHATNAFALFNQQYKRGYWTMKVYRHHKNTHHTFFESISIFNNATFPFWLMSWLIKGKVGNFPYILISEFGWRIGLLTSLISQMFGKE